MRRFPRPVLKLQEEADGKPRCDLAGLDLSPGRVQQTCPWSLESPEDATFLLFSMLYLASCKIPSQFSSCPQFSIWLQIFLAHTYHPTPQCSSPRHQQFLQKFKREPGTISKGKTHFTMSFIPPFVFDFGLKYILLLSPSIRNFSKNWLFQKGNLEAFLRVKFHPHPHPNIHGPHLIQSRRYNSLLRPYGSVPFQRARDPQLFWLSGRL